MVKFITRTARDGTYFFLFSLPIWPRYGELRARAAAGGARAEHGGGAPRERGSPGVGVGEAPEEARTGPGDTGQAEDRRAGLGVWERHGERATAVRADTRALYGFT